MAKKKLVQKIGYKKGVEVLDVTEILDLLKRSTCVYAKDQSIYDNGTQSISIEIHFLPKAS